MSGLWSLALAALVPVATACVSIQTPSPRDPAEYATKAAPEPEAGSYAAGIRDGRAAARSRSKPALGGLIAVGAIGGAIGFLVPREGSATQATAISAGYASIVALATIATAHTRAANSFAKHDSARLAGSPADYQRGYQEAYTREFTAAARRHASLSGLVAGGSALAIAAARHKEPSDFPPEGGCVIHAYKDSNGYYYFRCE